MTDQDNLSPFIAALRDTSRAAPDDSTTVSRIVESLRGHRERAKRRLRAVVLALLSLPLGASAFALWAGPSELMRIWLDARTAPAEQRPAKPPAREPERAPAAADNAADLPSPTQSDSAAPPMAAEQSVVTSPPAKVSRPARKEHAVTQPSAPQSAPDALYDEAHRLHFLDHNYTAALAAWDQYLNELPTPVLHVEAYYNRAICLLRLGRYEDAKRALNPFASGIHGKYRQREATALLRAIQDKHDPSD